MKKCPYCAEDIQDEAIKCKSCGEFLDDKKSPSPSPKQPLQQSPPQPVPDKKKKKKLTDKQILLIFGIVILVVLSVKLFRFFTFVSIICIILCLVYIFHSVFRNRVMSFLSMDQSTPRRGRALGIAGLFLLCLFLSVGSWGNTVEKEEQQRKREQEEIAANRARLTQVDEALSQNDFKRAEDLVNSVTAHKETSKLKAEKANIFAKKFADFHLKKSITLFNQKKWEEAADSFEIISSKVDHVPEKVIDYLYQIAIQLLKEDKYNTRALSLLKKHPDYKDSQKYISETTSILNDDTYKKAQAKYDEGMYEEAEDLFRSLGEYKDATAHIEKCKERIKEEEYKQAENLFRSKNYQEAKSKFSALGGYKKSSDYIQKIEGKIKDASYQEAQKLYKKKKYTEAKTILEGLGDYKNSKKLIDKVEQQERNARVVRLSYKQLKKNPDRYAGTYVKFKGKVFSIQESLGKTFMQINVSNKGYGFWTDQIIVGFNGETEIVEDNIITFYGTVQGAKSYTSVAGWDMRVPAVSADYLEW